MDHIYQYAGVAGTFWFSKFLSPSYLKWSQIDIPIPFGLRNRFESWMMNIFGGVTNFRDRVTNWTNGLKCFSPSKNEALGPHLSIYQGHVTYVALCRCVLAAFPILKPFFGKKSHFSESRDVVLVSYSALNIPLQYPTLWYRSRDPSPDTPGTLVMI